MESLVCWRQLLLPRDAPWLASFESELLGFPNARHDDQADALTQLMSWAMQLVATADYSDSSGSPSDKVLIASGRHVGQEKGIPAIEHPFTPLKN